MNKYYYCVNTFKDSEPVQISGYIKAKYETDVIQKLIDNGTIDPYSYEFLTLKNDDGELECYCPDCLMNPFNS